MKKRLTVALLLVVGTPCGIGLSDAYAQTQKSSPPTTLADESRELGRERLAQAQQASLAPAERMAWREIQERIDRMSHGEEAKDLNAAMHFMADDYTLYTLPDKDSPNGKVINKQQIAVYKKQILIAYTPPALKHILILRVSQRKAILLPSSYTSIT